MERTERETVMKKADGLHRAGRFFRYFGRKLLLIALLLALCVSAFTVCARLSGLYVLVNEGMALRFEYIVQDASLAEMRSYFTENCLLSDSRLQDQTYASYTVTGYNYSLSFTRFSLWPWQSHIEADVIEEADSITGTANSGDESTPPAWAPLKYRVRAVKENGSWRIDSLTVREVNPVQEPAATSDPQATPLPMATATPRA